MTHSAARLVRITTVAAAAVAALTLAGCTAPSGGGSPSSTPTAAVDAPAATLDCARILPVELAATALGLPAATLFDPTAPEPKDQQPSGGAIISAMQAAALEQGGLLSCGYSAPDNGTGVQADDGSHRLPNVTVAVLENAADEYSLVEPDLDDGLGGLVPADLSDRAFVACHPPESDSCRAEILVGTTWISARVTPRPGDAEFAAFADRVVDAVTSAAPTARASVPAKVGCDALLRPEDLAGAMDIQNARSEDYLAYPSRSAGIGTIAQVHAGLMSCSWLTAEPSESMNAVGVMILPGGTSAWDRTLPGGGESRIRYEALPGFGDAAYAGCEAGSCDVEVLAGDVWLSVRHDAQPAADLDGTKTLATIVLANYLATR